MFHQGFISYSLRSEVASKAPSALVVILGCALVFLGGCNTFSQASKPSTLGESVSGYTYIPIDPTKVEILTGECAISYSDIGDDAQKKKIKLLDMLPDNAVRMSMESINAMGKITYGVSKTGTMGSAYKLTADYVNSDTVNKSVWIRKTMIVESVGSQYDESTKKTLQRREVSRKQVPLREGVYGLASISDNSEQVRSLDGTAAYDVKSYLSAINTQERDRLVREGYEEFSVPIYVGIGLRIVAEGVSLSSDANISGIGVIGAEAEAKKLLGSLTVQTLGVNSQAVASALPVQSELSRTTAENAFVAIGSIKAMLHQPETIKLPRVVGLYLPFPGGKPLVNALISELSRNPVTWCPNGYAAKDTRLTAN